MDMEQNWIEKICFVFQNLPTNTMIYAKNC